MTIPVKISISPNVEPEYIGQLVNVGGNMVDEIRSGSSLNKLETGKRTRILEDGTIIIASVSFGETSIQIFKNIDYELEQYQRKRKECFCDCGVSDGYVFNEVEPQKYDMMICQDLVGIKEFIEKLGVVALDFYQHESKPKSSDDADCLCVIQDYDNEVSSVVKHIKLEDIYPCDHSVFRITSIERFSDDDEVITIF